jgi:hypothetical protein
LFCALPRRAIVATVRSRATIAIVVLFTAACTGDVNGAGSTSPIVDRETPPTSTTPSVSPAIASFDACVGSLQGICKNRALYLAGDRPHIVAEIQPHRPDMRAILLRRATDGAWQQIASVAVDDRGRMSWQWVTTDEDVRPHGAWAFRYRIPGHGQSDVVRVTIVAPDF